MSTSTSRSTLLVVNGGQTRIRVAGNPDGSSVLLLHGIDLSPGKQSLQQSQEWRDESTTSVVKCRRPAQVMSGVATEVLPVDHPAAAARLLPFPESRLFSDVCHMPQVEAPAALTELALGFTTSTEKQASTFNEPGVRP